MNGWSEPVPGAPMAEQVRVVCRHGGRGRRVHDVETFYRDPGWIGVGCGPLVEAARSGEPDRRPYLGGDLYQRGAGERRSVDRRSRLYHQTSGALPEWVGRCEACSRAPRERSRGRRTVCGEHRMQGDRLVELLNAAAAGWVEEIDLFDLANHQGWDTVGSILAARARVADSLPDEQALG